MDMDDLESWLDTNYQTNTQKYIENNSLLKSLKDKIISSDKIMKLLQTKTNESKFLSKKLANLTQSLKEKESISQELLSQVNKLTKAVELNKKLKASHGQVLAQKDSLINDLQLKISYIESENKIFRESSESYLAEKSKLKELVSQKETAEKKHLISSEKKDKLIKTLTQNCEDTKKTLSELSQKYVLLQQQLEHLKEQDRLSYAANAPQTQLANSLSTDDAIDNIIQEMTLPNPVSPLSPISSVEDNNNSFDTLPDQNGCDDTSDDLLAEMLETEFLKSVDDEVHEVQDAVILPNDPNNSDHLSLSPPSENYLETKQHNVYGNATETAGIVCDKNKECDKYCNGAEETCKEKALENKNGLRTKVSIEIVQPRFRKRSSNRNARNVQKQSYHNVAYTYTEPAPIYGAVGHEKKGMDKTGAKRCSYLSGDKKDEDEKNKNDKDPSIEYQNDTDRNTLNTGASEFVKSKADSKEISVNQDAKYFNPTADYIQPDSVTFHITADNCINAKYLKYRETTNGDEVAHRKVSHGRNNSIITDESLNKSENSENISREPQFEGHDKGKHNVKNNKSSEVDNSSVENNSNSDIDKPCVENNSNSDIDKPSVGNNSNSDIDKPSVENNSNSIDKPSVENNSNSDIDKPGVENNSNSDIDKPGVENNSNSIDKPSVGNNSNSDIDKSSVENNSNSIDKPSVGNNSNSDIDKPSIECNGNPVVGKSGVENNSNSDIGKPSVEYNGNLVVGKPSIECNDNPIVSKPGVENNSNSDIGKPSVECNNNSDIHIPSVVCTSVDYNSNSDPSKRYLGNSSNFDVGKLSVECNGSSDIGKPSVNYNSDSDVSKPSEQCNNNSDIHIPSLAYSSSSDIDRPSMDCNSSIIEGKPSLESNGSSYLDRPSGDYQSNSVMDKPSVINDSNSQVVNHSVDYNKDSDVRKPTVKCSSSFDVDKPIVEYISNSDLVKPSVECNINSDSNKSWSNVILQNHIDNYSECTTDDDHGSTAYDCLSNDVIPKVTESYNLVVLPNHQSSTVNSQPLQNKDSNTVIKCDSSNKNDCSSHLSSDYDESEIIFNNAETRFDNSEMKVETKITNIETKLNKIETIFNCMEPNFVNTETKLNNTETEFTNSDEIKTPLMFLPKISEKSFSKIRTEELSCRNSVASDKSEGREMAEDSVKNNCRNISSEEDTDFSDDSLELESQSAKKDKIPVGNGMQTTHQKLTTIDSSNIKVDHLIKAEHSYALDSESNHDSFTFSDSLSEQEPDLNVNKSYKTNRPISMEDLFGASSSDSENEDQFSSSNVQLKSVNNISVTETCSNFGLQDSKDFPMDVKKLEFEEMDFNANKNQPITCNSYKMSPMEDSPSLNCEINVKNGKVTATSRGMKGIHTTPQKTKESEELSCSRSDCVNDDIRSSESGSLNSASMLSVKRCEEKESNNIDCSKSVTEDVFDISDIENDCHSDNEATHLQEPIADTVNQKVFARDSNENVSSNDIQILIKEFILVAPLIIPFPDTLESIKRSRSTENHLVSSYLPVNSSKRPYENSTTLFNTRNGSLDQDEPVPKVIKKSRKVSNLPHNLMLKQDAPNKNSTSLTLTKRLLHKSRSLNRIQPPMWSKKLNQQKEFKKDSKVQVTTTKLTENQTQFDSLSELRSRKVEEMKKYFVKGGESVTEEPGDMLRNSQPHNSTAETKICKNVGEKKHKRLELVDDKPTVNSTEEYHRQPHKRLRSETRGVSEKIRPALQKVERELSNYWKCSSSPPSETVERILNTKCESDVIVNTLVEKIIKLLDLNLYEMVPWYYIQCNSGQSTPYLTEKESRLFDLITLIQKRSDVPGFVTTLRDSVQKAFYTCSSESNQLKRWSLCRVYVAICRLQGQLEMARIFFYNGLCQISSSQYMLFALTVSATWPLLLAFNREAGHVTLPHVIEHVVVNSVKGKEADKKILRCLQKLSGWSLQVQSKKNEVPRQLLAQLQGCLDVTMNRDDTFCLMKAIELLSLQENWSWTNSLVRNRIGPLLKKYLSLEDPNESVTSVLSFILEMLGNLYLSGKTRDKTACYAVNYLLKPLLESKKVPQKINHACAHILLKLFPFDPGTVYPTVQKWISDNPAESKSSGLAEQWATIKHNICPPLPEHSPTCLQTNQAEVSEVKQNITNTIQK
ncbi:probable serine/threonine-protein kinase DDB_G0282963 [Argonauta hians]